MGCPEIEVLYAQHKSIGEQINAFREACLHPNYRTAHVIAMDRRVRGGHLRICERCDKDLGECSPEERAKLEAEEDAAFERAFPGRRRGWHSLPIKCAPEHERPVGLPFNGQPIDPSVEVRLGGGHPPLAEQ